MKKTLFVITLMVLLLPTLLSIEFENVYWLREGDAIMYHDDGARDVGEYDEFCFRPYKVEDDRVYVCDSIYFKIEYVTNNPVKSTTWCHGLNDLESLELSSLSSAIYDLTDNDGSVIEDIIKEMLELKIVSLDEFTVMSRDRILRVLKVYTISTFTYDFYFY